MPMFLIYGQRRVGKSSLLKFLPRLLGSRFKVISQDFQNAKLNNLQAQKHNTRDQHVRYADHYETQYHKTEIQRVFDLIAQDLISPKEYARMKEESSS